jgi:hypothetical protein
MPNATIVQSRLTHFRYRVLAADRQPPGGLGHLKIESTVRYLGVEIDDALDIAEKIDA